MRALLLMMPLLERWLSPSASTQRVISTHLTQTWHLQQAKTVLTMMMTMVPVPRHHSRGMAVAAWCRP